jgi:hypothetical protein
MSGPVFDKNYDPMGDLTLKMAEELEPSLDDDNIEEDVKAVRMVIEEKAPEPRPVNEIFETKSVQKDRMEDTTGLENDDTPPPKPKKQRKKRKPMSEAQLAKLAEARAKSLSTRRAKAKAKKDKIEAERVARALKKKQEKEDKLDEEALKNYQTTKNGIPLKPPSPKKRVKFQEPANVFEDFDKFCNFMDRYDERKKKKHTTSRQPHPNQKIPERQRPRPPVQQNNRNPQFRTTGGARNKPPDDFSPYSLLKSGRGSVFGRSGMNGNGRSGW